MKNTDEQKSNLLRINYPEDIPEGLVEQRRKLLLEAKKRDLERAARFFTKSNQKRNNSSSTIDSPSSSSIATARIKEKIISALSQGFNTYENKIKHGFSTEESGWLTWLRHGSTGEECSKTLAEELNSMNNIREIFVRLDEFFFDSSRRYHTHSLASYLLNALNQLLEEHSYPSLIPEENQHYNCTIWSKIKSQFELLTADNTFQENTRSVDNSA